MLNSLAVTHGFLEFLSQGLGRLHLVLLHFPLALLVVAAGLEVWARMQGRGVCGAASTCLKIGAAGGVVAMGTGWLYAAGMRTSETVELHRWLGTAAAGLAVVAVIVQSRLNVTDPLVRGRTTYGIVLIGAAALTGAAGHFGGEAVHGAGYTLEPWKQMIAGRSATPAVPVSQREDQPHTAGMDTFAPAWALLEQHCISCHGPTKRRGNLRVDSREALVKGGKHGAAIDPRVGGGDTSYLIHRVRGDGEEERMPPEDEGPGLTDAEIGVLQAWIEAGAPWPQEKAAAEGSEEPHWAFVSVSKPVAPKLREGGWGLNEVDGFISQRMMQQGLEPTPRAEPGVLLRRLTLDLTGLPPSVEALDAFEADSSEGAYRREVERLLASPAYGERWARPWLDIARYGDSRGYEKDQTWIMWPYRDWLIDALNADTPFNRFTVEQIAGDLLPDASEQQRVATAFLRLSMLNEEGGVDPEEARVAAVVDRVETVAAAWLGATVGCARCHDHKFDPVSQREFFSLYAYFNSSAEETRQIGDGETHVVAPTITLAGRPGAEVGVMKELESPRETRVHVRGSFLDPGEEVKPDVPLAMAWRAVRPVRADRLGLAEWLTDPSNPLTARVQVNRIWSGYFGRGLVETEEDFGTRGSPPSHPGLLDWLAAEFVESGWSQKHIHRFIVLSETYRQGSTLTEQGRERDPENVWLSRSPRYRLDAESVRDQALFLGGLLSLRVGGPSVKPPQPLGVWGHAYSAEKWIESQGEDRYRRGVYTFIKRATPYPSMTAFDAPSRQVACVKRVRSNTPLAALVTLNDPVFIEAAAGLALRVQGVRGEDEQRLVWAFRACTGRRPEKSELAILNDAISRARAGFAGELGEAEAAKLLSVTGTRRGGSSPEAAELAAWTVLCNVLLNLDEVLCKG